MVFGGVRFAVRYDLWRRQAAGSSNFPMRERGRTGRAAPRPFPEKSVTSVIPRVREEFPREFANSSRIGGTRSVTVTDRSVTPPFDNRRQAGYFLAGGRRWLWITRSTLRSTALIGSSFVDRSG